MRVQKNGWADIKYQLLNAITMIYRQLLEQFIHGLNANGMMVEIIRNLTKGENKMLQVIKHFSGQSD